MFLRRPVRIAVDAVILSAATVAAESADLATLLKVPRNASGFFIEAHAKLRPVDFASEGIYLCGTAHSPKLISESITQGPGGRVPRRFLPGRRSSERRGRRGPCGPRPFVRRASFAC